jgi:hypothetical protein
MAGLSGGMVWPAPAFAGAAMPTIAPVSVPRSPAAATAAPQVTPGAAARGGGSTVVHQTVNVTVNLQELEEMVEAGRFVRDLDSARTLYLGSEA